jgi:tetratricopeptide (TPR) repeat protein
LPERSKALSKTKTTVSSREAFLIGALLLLGTLPYLNTLGNSFVYDDDYQVLSNPYLRSFHHIRQIVASSVWSFRYSKVPTNYYRPMMMVQYLLLYQIYGPLAYMFHLGNLILHVLVVILIFLLTRRLFRSEAIGFLSAAIFALHPIHTEAVAWVAAVSDLQLGVFILLTFWFFLNLADPKRNKWWTAPMMCFCFILSLLSKEPAIAFPVIAVAYEHFFADDRMTTSWREKMRRYTPLWVVAAIYMTARIGFMGSLVPRLQRPGLPWGRAILSSVTLTGDYLTKLVWPSHLSALYSFVATPSIHEPGFIAGVAWILGVLLLFFLLWKKNRMAAFGIVWLVPMLAPALNARWMAANVFSERYLYVPSIGFCWLVAVGIVALWNIATARRLAFVKIGLASACLVVAGFASVRIVKRNTDWHDELTFYRVMVAQNPNNATAHCDLGSAYWNQSQFAEALKEWNTALQCDPNNVVALGNLGRVAVFEGRYSDAIPILRKAIKINASNAEAHVALAQALAGQGHDDEAEREFLTAIQISAYDSDAYNALAKFYEEKGRIPEAETAYRKSAGIMQNTDGLDGLADIELKQNRLDEAEKYYRQAAEFDSYDHHAIYELAIIYAKAGRLAEAEREYQAGEKVDIGTDPLAKQARTEIDARRGH